MSNPTNPNAIPAEIEAKIKASFAKYLPIAIDTFEDGIRTTYGEKEYTIQPTNSQYDAKKDGVEITLIAAINTGEMEDADLIRGVYTSPELAESTEGTNGLGTLTMWDYNDDSDLIGYFVSEESNTFGFSFSSFIS